MTHRRIPIAAFAVLADASETWDETYRELAARIARGDVIRGRCL